MIKNIFLNINNTYRFIWIDLLALTFYENAHINQNFQQNHCQPSLEKYRKQLKMMDSEIFKIGHENYQFPFVLKLQFKLPKQFSKYYV